MDVKKMKDRREGKSCGERERRENERQRNKKRERTKHEKREGMDVKKDEQRK